MHTLPKTSAEVGLAHAVETAPPDPGEVDAYHVAYASPRLPRHPTFSPWELSIMIYMLWLEVELEEREERAFRWAFGPGIRLERPNLLWILVLPDAMVTPFVSLVSNAH